VRQMLFEECHCRQLRLILQLAIKGFAHIGRKQVEEQVEPEEIPDDLVVFLAMRPIAMIQEGSQIGGIIKLPGLAQDLGFAAHHAEIGQGFFLLFAGFFQPAG